MSTEERTTDESDFYMQLMNTIEGGDTRQAVKMIRTLEGQQPQLDMLTRLTSALDAALDIRGANTLDLDRARALARARDRALELQQNLDLEHAHALEEAIDRARALYLNLDRATRINKTIIAFLSGMNNGSLNPTVKTRSTSASSTGFKLHSGQIMTIALVCVVICIVAAWMLVRG